MRMLKKVINQPLNLRVIGNNAFTHCVSLETCLFNGNIISIKNQAFNQAFTANGKTDFTVILGSKLLYLGDGAFSNMDLLGMQFIIGEEGNSLSLDLTRCYPPSTSDPENSEYGRTLIYNNTDKMIKSITIFGSQYTDASDIVINVYEPENPREFAISSFFSADDIYFS